MTVNSEELLSTIKNGVTVPSAQVRFSDTNLLSFADEETQATILPALLSIRENFLLRTVDVDVVANQGKYKVPYRAVGRSLRDLKLAHANNQYFRSLANIDVKDKYRFAPNIFGEPLGFVSFSDYVELVPTPQTSNAYVLKMTYELAPSRLVASDTTGVITNVDFGTGVITLSSTVAAFTVGALMDITDYQSGNTIKALDIANTNISGNAITFTPADLPTDIVAGDILSLAQETSLVQLPQELTQSLVQAVICRILEAQGDFEGLQAAEMKLNKKLDAAMGLLSPRVQSERPVVINRSGLLYNRPYNFRFRYIP